VIRFEFCFRYAGGIGFGVLPFFISPLDIHFLIRTLETDRAVSIPLLTQSATQVLLREAEGLYYEPEIKTVGTGDRVVRTEYSVCNHLPEIGLFPEFKRAFQILIDQPCNGLRGYPFNTPLQFTDTVIQRYEPGQLGITPHRDSLRAINLIVLINLGGEADFYRCDDRQGTHAVRLDTTPGNGIFLRAPGFLSTSVRPFHFLTNIRSTRYSLGLRQRMAQSS
jgi:hypothetical protein